MRLSDDDVKTFLTVRDDPEPLYFWASDLSYCGYTAAAVQLLREAIRRNYCASAAIETDPMFASIRGSAEYGEVLDGARACRARFQGHVRARCAGTFQLSRYGRESVYQPSFDGQCEAAFRFTNAA